jgi:hypothetical protein
MFKILVSELLSKKSRRVMLCVLSDIIRLLLDSCQAIFGERFASEMI